MKFLLLFMMLFVYANADVYTQKLYETILGSIFKERPIVVFATGDAKATLEKSSMFYVVNSCQDNTLAVVDNGLISLKKCKNIPIFATTHKTYMDIADAFGAFYWRKGRPQIHFRERGLEMFHLNLPHNLERFVDVE